jgi:Site-specific recombinase XerD
MIVSSQNNCGKTKKNDDLNKAQSSSIETKLNRMNNQMDELTEDLIDKSPSDAAEDFLEYKSYPDSSRRGYESSINKYFVKWCGNISEITYMSDLDREHIRRYRKWRKETAPTKVDELSPSSINTQMKRLRVFLKYCENTKKISKGLSKIINTSLDDDDEVRDEWIEPDKAEAVLDHLAKYSYASGEHVVCRILWYTGMRIGSVQSIDVTDIQSVEGTDAIHLEHRPDEGTRLKNGTDGERYVLITEETRQVLDDYIENNRHDVTDEYGREPLLTSSNGRAVRSTLRSYVYKCTQPCMVGRDCPVGKDPENCDAAGVNSQAHDCPGAYSTHPFRKGHITKLLQDGRSTDVISARCDVSPKMIDKHYDMRSSKKEMMGRSSKVKDMMSEF